MRQIAFICTSMARGGLEKNLVETAAALFAKKHPILIITVQDSFIHERAKALNINCVLINKPAKYFDIISAFRIYKIIKEFSIFHLVVFDNKDSDFVSLIKFFTQKIKLYYHQNMHIGGNKKDFFHTIRYKRFNIWISPLPYLAKEVKDLTNFPIENVRVIPIGVDNFDFMSKLPKEEAKSQLGIDKSKFVIGLIGRIDEQKGQISALEAIAKLNNGDFLLLIAGEPTLNEGEPYYEKILDFIDKNKLNDKVKIIGFAKNISSIFSALDLFILASHSETYGLVTIEAMMAQVPIIATKSGGTIELTQNGRFAELFSPKDSEELAQKILKVYSDYSIYKANSLIAEDYANENYTKNKECNRLADLFMEQENV